MYVVGVVQREHNAETAHQFVSRYPVVFEDQDQGYAHPPVDYRADPRSRAEAGRCLEQGPDDLTLAAA